MESSRTVTAEEGHHFMARMQMSLYHSFTNLAQTQDTIRLIRRYILALDFAVNSSTLLTD